MSEYSPEYEMNKLISMANIRELKPNPKNPNKHTSEQINRLAQILEYQGWRHPIVVSERSGYIAAGHGRLEAAKQLGWTEVPVSYQNFESDEQEYAFLVSDNSIASWAELDLASINLNVPSLGPDFDIDLLGIKDFVLEPAEKFNGDPDEVPDVPKEAKTKLGELWMLGEHRLLVGDCTVKENVERLMNGDKTDMVFTDPPYGLNFNEMTSDKGSRYLRHGHQKDIIGNEDTETAKKATAHLLKLGIPTVIFGANYFANFLPLSRGWIVWDKQVLDKSVCFSDCEIAWTSLEKPQRIFRHVWDGFRKDSEKGESRIHISQKPIALAEWCFENYGEKNCESVLDIFIGSGSTLIACEKTNRKCYGMEIDPHYCDVILDRWEKFSGKKAKREDGTPWGEIP